MSLEGQTAAVTARSALFMFLGLALSLTSPAFDAVLLPQQGPWAQAADDLRLGLIAAYAQSNRTSSNPTELRFYDSSQGNIRALYASAVHDGADFIIGPLEKDKVDALLSDGQGFAVKTLLLNRSTQAPLAQSWQFSLSLEDEIPTLVATARRAGIEHALIVYDDDGNYAQRAHTWAQAWRAAGGSVIEEAALPAHATLMKTLQSLLFSTSEQKRGHGRHARRVILQTPRPIDALFIACGQRNGSQIYPLLQHLHRNLPRYALSSAVDMPSRRTQWQDLIGLVYTELPGLLQAPDSLRLFDVLMHQRSSDQRLFVMGMDSWALARQLGTDHPSWPYQGLTGRIEAQQGLLQRQLPASRIAGDGPHLIEQP